MAYFTNPTTFLMSSFRGCLFEGLKSNVISTATLVNGEWKVEKDIPSK